LDDFWIIQLGLDSDNEFNLDWIFQKFHFDDW
jgi:hypothetical protein